jgi:hypothetical protein
MTKKIPGTYAELKHLVSLTGIPGVWRDLGNQKQFCAKNGAIMNWWESTRSVTFQGRSLPAKKLEAALSPKICQTKIAAKTLEAKPLRHSQEFAGQTSNKTCRSLGILRPAKITTKPLSPNFSGNLHLQRNILEAIAKQWETIDQAEVICDVWVYNDEGGRYLTVEISPSYKRM